MYQNELQYNNKPAKGTKVYFLVFFLMCLVFAALLANNIMIYRSYDNTVKKLNKELTQNKIDAQNLKMYNEVKSKNEELEKSIKNYEELNNSIMDKLDELKQENTELQAENKQLVEDNIALQNSLKMAASDGTKPQNYTPFPGISQSNQIKKGEYLGKFLGTAYTPSSVECGNNLGITNSGKPIIPGLSLAVDTNYWPFGTIFYIKGLGYAVAMDTGSAIKGRNRFDFAVFDKSFANNLGKRKWEVYLVKMGNGKIDKIKF